MYRPPRPRSTTTSQTGVGNEADGWTSPMPQVALGRVDPEANRSEGGLDHAGVGLMHRRVVPPAHFDGRMPQDLFQPEPVDVEEVCTGAMDSGSYFIDLLVNDVEESQDLPPPSHTTNDHAHVAAKGSQGRSKNFRDEEDILLVSAWLNVGMDPIQGIDQPLGTYWRRIHEYFHANKTFESDHTKGSLMNRWSSIQHDVNVFCGCVSRIEARNHSGWSIDDKIANACTLFKAEEQKKFSYMHCWKILKDKPKWLERRKQLAAAKTASNKKQKTVANSSPAFAPAGAADAEPSENALARPEGKKKEKQKLRQRSTVEALDYLMAKMKEADVEKDLKKEERCKQAFALQEERIKLEREKFEFQRELEEEIILTLDLSTMTYKQQQYYKRRQNEILARRYGC